MAASSPVDPSLYRLLVEQTKDYGVFILDLRGHIVTWNLGAELIKGYKPHEIIGRHFSVFYPPEAIASGWPAHELKVAAAEGQFEDEGWRLRKDGTRFWANVIITALHDETGTLIGFSKITRDLTERRLHEEALRQSEERFRLLVEGVTDYAIFMLDREGTVTSWNAGAERIKGYSRSEVLGTNFSRFYPPEDAKAGKPQELLAEAKGTGRAMVEGWRVRKNGERFWARAIVTALHDGAGKLRGYAKVTQDMTQHRHTQDLERAAKNVNEFIGMLAHELRNPLAPIRNAVHVMANVPPQGEVHEAMRQAIDRQSAHLTRIVDDLVDISRITRGALHIDRKPVDLSDVVRVAVETAAPAIDAAHHRLEVNLAPEPLPVSGDAQRLNQALTNLLNNAARYTPENGEIVVTAKRENGTAVVRVRDNGRGISPDLMSRIFDMFVQGRAPIQRVGGGLGIGLALARKIAELHSGTLEGFSAGEGKGSEFVLRLPVADPALLSGSPNGPRQAKATPIQSKRILVVDDNVDAAVTLDLLLRALGHETVVVHDGHKALAAAADFNPEVVLLDIGMPGLDGYEVARRLRAAGRPTRIIAITGWGQDVDRQRSREAGFDMHLVKPVDAARLERILGERNGAAAIH